MKTMDFSVNGMSCGHCIKTITSSLTSVEGVSHVDVSLTEKKVTVSFEEAKVNSEILKSKIVEAGYEIA